MSVSRHGGSETDRAVSLHRSGHLTRARRLYEEILARDPDDVRALHFLGVLYHQSGQSDRAIESIERAVALAPDYADAHNNLGNVLKETRRLDAAFVAYRRVVDLDPGHADAWNNLGVVLRAQGRYDEADQAYVRAIEARPTHAAAWLNRGHLLARMRRLDEAAAAYSRVLELRPRDTAAYDALTRTLYRAGRVEEAIAVFRQWLTQDPGSSIARHMLAACTGAAAPVRASDAYVRDTFDAFAADFDQVLDHLGYRAPGLIAELLDRLLPAPDRSLVIADAGCGTGLCADFLRPRAKRLIGVDLSPGMLAKARARGQYDDLAEAELSAWLATQAQAVDLIVSADTLCYLGSLEQPLSAARRALRPGGLFVFTLERQDEDARDYRLTPSGRYSHALPYVRTALARSGFDRIEIGDVVLRRENGEDVPGLLVRASRPA